MALEFFTPKDLSPALEWEIVQFLDSQTTSHPFQFPKWADSGARFAMLRQAERVCWFANCGVHFPLGTRFAGFRALTVNRGPVCDDSELLRMGLNELADKIHGEGLVYLDVAPDWPRRLGPHSAAEFDRNWKPLGEGRVSLRLNLIKAADELLAKFRKNTRYEVRRGERANILVEPATKPEDIEDFLKLYLRLASRKGFSAGSSDHLRSILGWLITEPSRGALLLARDGGRVAGGAAIVRSGKRCWYVWGASDKHDRFSAGHTLQWHGLLWAKSQGCVEYDFGGYTPGATSGPAWFKEGFGGEIVRFVPAHRFVLRTRYHAMAQAVAKIRRPW
jgi:lipid II:glycine glycyltransferase (peptidoglycan interpeptide bridge formation enzyme)